MNKIKSIILLCVISLLVPSCGSSFSSDSFSSTDEESKESSSESIPPSEQPACLHTSLGEEEVIKKPSIIEPGINRYKCLSCGKDIEKNTYKLDEYVFEDAFYMYDGESHDLLIKGMIPYGTYVKYENNITNHRYPPHDMKTTV